MESSYSAASTKHGDYEDILEWLGEDFDPEYFDPKDVSFWVAKISKFVSLVFGK